jgi:hypothetical protein
MAAGDSIPMSPFFCHDLMPMRAMTGDGVNDWNADGHRFASLTQMGRGSHRWVGGHATSFDKRPFVLSPSQ